MPRKPRKPKRLFRNRTQNAVFPIEETAVIHGVWFLQCGTGNLVSIIWENPGQPLMSRARHENQGRKQVFSYGKPNASLPEMIANTRKALGGYAAEMERRTGQPMPVRQKLGPMIIHDMVDWLERTGELQFTNGEIVCTTEDARDPEEKRVDDHYWPQF